MAKDLEVKLRISADGKAAVSGLKEVERGLTGVGTAAEQTQLDSAALLGTLAKYGGAAAVIGGLTSALSSWAEASAVQIRAEAQLTQALENTSQASEDQIQALKDLASAQQELTGYGDEATIQAQAFLSTFGLTAEAIGILTPRLLDMAEAQRAVGSGQVDLKAIAQQLGKAFSDDSAAGLRRYGVTLTDAQEEQLKVATGMEKVALLSQILDGNFGGLASAVGATYEGALRKSAAAQGDLLEALGDLVTKSEAGPVALNAWTDSLTEMTGWLKDNAAVVRELAGDVGYAALAAVILKSAQAATVYGKSLVASARDQVSAAQSAKTLAAAEQQAARTATLAARERLAAAQSAVAAAQLNLTAAKEVAAFGPQMAAAERAVTVAQQQHTAATTALTAANGRYAASTQAATAATTAAAATNSVASVALAKMGALATTLGSALSAIPYVLIVAQLLEIASNISKIVDQYEEMDRIGRDLQDAQAAVQAAATANMAAFAANAEQAIRAEEDLVGLSRSQATVYLEGLQSASRYWAAVAIQAREAGELSRQQEADARASQYATALDSQRKIIEELIAQQARLSPVAADLLAQFDAATEKSQAAASAIGSLVSALRFDTAAEAMVNVAAVEELITKLGTANEETGEKIRATERDITEGLAPALDKLSGESLRNFADRWTTTLTALGGEPVATTAAVLDTVLGAALRKLSLNLDELRTGTTEAGRNLTASFQAVSIAAQGDFEIVYAAWQKVLGGLKSVQDADLARQAIEDLGTSGRLSLGDLTTLTGELDAALRRLEATTGETADAFARLGVTSQAELKVLAEQARQDFETIRTSGTATATDIAAAYEAYAKRAVAAGDSVTLAEARQEAYRSGQVATLDKLVSLTKSQAAAAADCADATERQAEAAGDSADAAERQASTSCPSAGTGGGGSSGGGGTSGSSGTRTVTITAPSERTGVATGGGLGSSSGVSAAMQAEIDAANQLLADAQAVWASQPLVIPFTLSDRTENAIAAAALAQGARI